MGMHVFVTCTGFNPAIAEGQSYSGVPVPQSSKLNSTTIYQLTCHLLNSQNNVESFCVN